MKKNGRRKPKTKKPKLRVPVPPPNKRHKTVKDYERNKKVKHEND